MKKLLTLLGITAFALGAFAGELQGNSITFETGYTAEQALDVTGSQEGSQSLFWVCTNTNELEATVKSYGDQPQYAGDRNTVFTGNNSQYLAIEQTGSGAPLYRTFNTVYGNGGATSADSLVDEDVTVSIGNGLYVDTLVKLSVSEESMDPGEGVKLAIWAQKGTEDSDPTNFVVHAGYFTGESTLVTNNYTMATPANFDFDAWHRLTVKAIEDIGNRFVGFVVFVDEQPLEREGSLAASGVEVSLNSIASQYANSVLPSAVSSGGYKTTLSAVGFAGNGSVDDIVMTDVAPDFAKSALVFTLTVGEGITGFTLSDGAGNSKICANLTENDSVSFTIAGSATSVTVSDVEYYDNDYKNAALSDQTQGTVNGLIFTLDLDATAPAATISAVRDLFTITVGGETRGYATLADALVDASRGTIVLKDAYSIPGINALSIAADTVIDLAGNTLTAPQGDAFFNIDENKTLTIVNSSENDGFLIGNFEIEEGTDAEEVGLISGLGNLVVGATTDLGYVVMTNGWIGDVGEMTVVKGKFDATWNTADDECVIETAVAKGSELSDGPVDGYWVVDVADTPVVTTYDFTVALIANTTVSYVIDNGEPVAVSGTDAVVEVNAGSTITVTYVPAEGYEITEGAAVAAYDGTDAVTSAGQVTVAEIETNQAKIGDQKYATIAEALAAYKSEDVIELLPPATNLTGWIKVFNKAGAFTFKYDAKYVDVLTCLTKADNDEHYCYNVVPPAGVVDDTVTYTVSASATVAGLAVDDNTKWYSSFREAYMEASEGASLLVKIDADFTPDFTAGWGSKSFVSVTFQTESAEPLSIATTANGVSMTAATWVAPANVTLILDSQTVTSVTAGTLNVPAGVTLTLANESAIDNVSALTGTGVVSLPYGTAPSSVVQALCQANGWEGTLVINGTDIGVSAGLGRFGNSKSTVRFNNCGLTLANTGNGVKALEIASGGLELMGEYYQGSFAFPCALTGTGPITVSVKNSPSGSATKVLNFTGDTSGFTGSISFNSAANARVVFGSGSYPTMATAADNRQIVVLSDMTLPSAATWNAPSGVYVYGGLDVQGTLTVPEKGLYGAGVVKFHNKNKAVKVSDDWTGTYRVDWAHGNNRFVFADYGNANSTVEIVNANFGAFPSTDPSAGEAPNIASTVKLSANWTIANGWTDKATTFAKLTGTGDLIVNGASPTTGDDVLYTITRLEEYTGTLGGARGKFKIETIVAATEPVPNTKLVKLGSGVRAFRDLDQTVVVYNNATVENITLEQKSDGIYVASPAPSEMTPDTPADVPVDPTATEEQAQTAANAMDVAKTADASGVDQATWNGYFTKTVEKVDDKWVATAALNPAAVLPVDDTVVEAKLTDMLESVTAAALDDKKPTAVPTKAGLYYWIAGATEVGATTYTPGTAALGDGTKKALPMPTLQGEDGKAFYKVCVGLEDPNAE